MIQDLSFAALPADKACDAEWLLQNLDQRGATAVIAPKANRKGQRDYDIHMYKWRRSIENYFARIKEFRGIETRYELRRQLAPLRKARCSTVIVNIP